MNIFITATNTNLGKNYASKLLIKELSACGHKVGVYKPIETGFVSYKDSDAYILLQEAKKYNSSLDELSLKDVCPYQFSLASAPIIAKKGLEIKQETLINAMNKLKKLCSILIIEGAGGLYVPIERYEGKTFFMIDLIKLFNARSLLVSHSSLGCINDSILSKQALQMQGLDFVSCVNLFNNGKGDNSFFNISLPYYEDSHQEVLFLEKDIKIIARRLSK